MPGATVEERALNLLPYVLKYHGDLDVGELVAIAEHESINFTKFLGPSTTACGATGNATGVWQVMSSCFDTYRLNASSACDLDESTKQVVRVLTVAHEDMLTRAPEAKTDAQVHAYLLYVAHHAGRGGMDSLITKARAATSGTLTVNDLYSASNDSYKNGYLTVSARAAYWRAWAGPAQKTYDAESPWAMPLLLTASALVAAALGTAIYLERSGSRSRWVHWAPGRA